MQATIKKATEVTLKPSHIPYQRVKDYRTSYTDFLTHCLSFLDPSVTW